MKRRQFGGGSASPMMCSAESTATFMGTLEVVGNVGEWGEGHGCEGHQGGAPAV